jgi:hypothetical protein
VTPTSADEQRLRESSRHAPRIFIVSAERWPRALLRAELRHAGYDAIGASTLARTLRYPPADPERGPVRLIVVDSAAVVADPTALEDARRRYPGLQVVLVHRAGAPPPGPWAATLQRPVTIGDIAASARRLVPLPDGQTDRDRGSGGDAHGQRSIP